MDRLTYRDDTGRAVLTRYGMRMYCSTQATADCFAHLEEIVERTMPKWISVKKRLPESGTRVLVMRFDYVTKTPFYDLLWFDNGKWRNRHFTGNYAVTHWMPLPEPPKEGANTGGE